MRRDRPAPAHLTAKPVLVDQPHPAIDAAQPRFATTIAHLGLVAEAAVHEAREARFQAARQQRDAQQGGLLRRIFARLRPGR